MKDGLQVVMSASMDGTVKLWATDSPACLMTLVNRGSVLCAAFSSEGEILVTGSADSLVRVWDMKMIEPLIVNQTSDRYLNFLTVQGADCHKGEITCVDFNSDGCCFATGSADNTIKLYKYHYDGEMLLVKCFVSIGGHKDCVSSIKFSPDGGRLISSGAGSPNLHVWWGAGPTHMTNLVGHTMGSKAVGCLPNQWLAMRRWPPLCGPATAGNRKVGAAL